jgi:membrane protease YdiL (CAAX protease family)
MPLEHFAVAVGYLLAIGLAETLTVWVNPRLGFVLYSLILLVLLFQAAFSRQRTMGRLCLALVLIPLMRIVSTPLSLGAFHPIGRYLVVMVPLFGAAALVIYYLALRPGQIGLGLGKGPFGLLGYLPVILTGLPLGLAEYYILKPAPLVNPPTSAQVGIAVLVLSLCTGFFEELLFRGILLHVSRDLLGDWASVLYASLLFGMLQLGYRSGPHVLLVLAANLFFGWVVLKTRTIYSVSLAHGLTNTVVFLLAPLWFAR